MTEKEQLKNYLSSKTANNYQEAINKIGNILYTSNFIPTKQFGGDGGIDAILKNGKRVMYIAIGGYSSTKDIEKKILSDSKSIKLNVLEKKQWSFDENIDNEIIFITQTIDQPLPNSIQGRTDGFNKKVKEILKTSTGKYVKYRILNTLMLVELFNEIQINKLYKEIFSGEKIFEQLEAFIHYSSYNTKTKYKRISTDEKIRTNHLIERKELIENTLLDLTFIDAFELWLKEFHHKKIFNDFKEYVIEKYMELNSLYNSSVEVFEKLIDFIYEHSALTYDNSRKMIVYIFDRCDIFE